MEDSPPAKRKKADASKQARKKSRPGKGLGKSGVKSVVSAGGLEDNPLPAKHKALKNYRPEEGPGPSRESEDNSPPAKHKALERYRPEESPGPSGESEDDSPPAKHKEAMGYENLGLSGTTFVGTTGLAALTRYRLEESPGPSGVSEDNPPPAKHKRTDTTFHMKGYSSISQRIMASMGFQMGQSLGRSGEGIVDPIEESVHKGRRGLGFALEGLEKEDVKWELEEVLCEQTPEWMDPCSLPVPTALDLSGWMEVGERKATIKDETTFCDPDILHRILNAKSVFDNLSEKEFLDARQRSNPFETIKGAIFQNRAAMKMANIESVFKFMFTEPKKRDGSDLLGPMDVLYFADICAGPGGFSEYVLWRKKWHSKGFGFTLKDPYSGSDFKLDAFLAAPCETFDPHYGVGGYDGDGDIMNPENLSTFREYVLKQTGGKGVHFVMGDGGISVEGQENIQEILTKQLVLCQYICALSILMKGGHFVCKVFDMFTPFSVGLFYLLYRCFRQVCIFKPITSRPANSERYVVCKDFQSGSEAIHDYLFEVNINLHRLEKDQPSLDVLEVVPHYLLEDESFYTYIQAYNDSFGVNQILHLKKLQYFVKNTNLKDDRQDEIRRKCLQLWKVPITPRTVPSSDSNPQQVFNEFWKQLDLPRSDRPAEVGDLDSKHFKPVDRESLGFLKDIHSWRWCWACGKRLMLVGLGRNKVYAWDMKGSKAVFTQQSQLKGLELPMGTVIEVELLQELKGEGRGQRKQDTLYIVDVIAIHGKLYGNKPLKERHLLAEKLCKVLNKPCRKGTILLKAKIHYRAAELPQHFTKLSLKECKGYAQPIPTFPLSDSEDSFIAPVGVIFFKIIKDPWQLHPSKSGRLYFFNGQTGQSQFDCPTTSVSPFLSVLGSRHFWLWNRAIFQDLCGNETDTDPISELTRSYLCNTITQTLGHKSEG